MAWRNMAKQGRPGIPYEDFVVVWEQLLQEGRAGSNTAHDLLGGSKSTIAAYRGSMPKSDKIHKPPYNHIINMTISF